MRAAVVFVVRWSGLGGWVRLYSSAGKQGRWPSEAGVGGAVAMMARPRGLVSKVYNYKAVRCLVILRRAGHNVVLAMAGGPFVTKPGCIDQVLCAVQSACVHARATGPTFHWLRWQIRNSILVHIALLKHLFSLVKFATR